MAKKKTTKKKTSSRGARSIVDTIRDIAGDAQDLVDLVTPKAAVDDTLSASELASISKLVKRAETALSDASVRAKQSRQQEIKELEKLVKSFTTALGVPGLSASARDNLKAIRRNRRAKLLRLQTQAAVDFGGILKPDEIKEIETLLKAARRDVARKKKAAAFVSTLLQIADKALIIAGKIASAM